MKKAVILLSGGLDSTTCLAHAKAEGFACYTMSFNYGQKNRAELIAAARIAHHFGAEQHQEIKLPIGELGGSALTDVNIQVPDYSGLGKIPVTYVPARNTVFLSIALGWAEILCASAIFVGVSHVDYSGYPDCRPAFIDAFQALIHVATKAGVEGQFIQLQTPLIHLSKAETIAMGLQLGIDYSHTVSCYQSTDEGLACGRCDSCFLRKQGFQEAGLADPTRYIKV